MRVLLFTCWLVLSADVCRPRPVLSECECHCYIRVVAKGIILCRCPDILYDFFGLRLFSFCFRSRPRR